MGVLLWLSDLHLDPFYGTELAASHKTGENCSLSENRTLVEHPLGRVGCDAPPSLLESALHDASRHHTTNDIDWVLITGDFSRHSLDALGLRDPALDPLQVARSILATSIRSIQRSLPGVPILPVLGNNDVVPDYYLEEASADDSSDESADDNESMEPTHSPNANANSNANANANSNANANEQDHGQPSLPDPKRMLESVTQGLSKAFATPQEAHTFAHGGYFARLLPLSSSSSDRKLILLLSLNTILYSSRHQPDYYMDDNEDPHRLLEDPYGQFAWMESQLRQAALSASATAATFSNATTASDTTTIVGIYVAGHIPPTVGSYRHTQLWKAQYLETFAGLLHDYSSGKYNPPGSGSPPPPPPPILGQFYGHVHTEEFRLLALDAKQGTGDRGGGGDDPTASNATASASTPPLVVPLLVTSSITPIYGSNPSYRLVEYNDTTGALLDYKTHYLDLDRSDRIHSSNNNDNNNNNSADATASNPADSTKTNATGWIELPGFVQAYGVPDLSPQSFQSLVARLEGEFQRALCPPPSTNDQTTTLQVLWDTFWRRQNLYSTAPDDGDDNGNLDRTVVMMDWLCTIQASNSDDYENCRSASQQLLVSPPCLGSPNTDTTNSKNNGNGTNVASWGGHGRMVLWASIGSLAGVLLLVVVLVVVVWKKRCSKRRMYAVPVDHHDRDRTADHPLPPEDSGDGTDGVFVMHQRTTKAIPNPDGELA